MGKTDLESVRLANATFAQDRPLTVVSTGGTSGIGEYTIYALAQHFSRSRQLLRIYIVGRGKASADRIIAKCREICPDGDFRFVQASDLSLIRDVDRACDEVNRLEREIAVDSGRPACVDLLLMSHADSPFNGRRETEEGLEKALSLLYYSRMRLAVNLLPLLRASDRHAHVISVFGAGLENIKSWHPEDLLLQQPGHFSLDQYRTHAVIMKALFMEKLAQDSAGKVAFAHVFPGLVITPAFNSPSHPWWFKVAWAVLGPFAKALISISPAEVGERMMFLASSCFPPTDSTDEMLENRNAALHTRMSTNGARGGGAYSCNQHSQANDLHKIYDSIRKQNDGQKVVDHTMQVFQQIESNGVFKG